MKKAISVTPNAQEGNTRIQLFLLSKEPVQTFKLPAGAHIISADNVKEHGRLSVELNPSPGIVKENRIIQVIELPLNGSENPFVDAKMPANYECIFIGNYTLDYFEYYVYEARKK